MRCDAKLISRVICACGNAAIYESIPLGTIYKVDPRSAFRLRTQCGGCKKIKEIVGIFADARDASGKGGYMPIELFEIDEGFSVDKDRKA